MLRVRICAGGVGLTGVPTATKLFRVVISRCAATWNLFFCRLLATRSSLLRSQWRVQKPSRVTGHLHFVPGSAARCYICGREFLRIQLR
jgi:hypothetical protein